MQSIIATPTIRRPTEVAPQEFESPMGSQNRTLEYFPEGEVTHAGVRILLSETKEEGFQTTKLAVIGDDRHRVIATLVNQGILDTNVQDEIGWGADKFGFIAYQAIEALLPARLTRDSVECSFLEVELLPILSDLAALYRASDKSEQIAIPKGVPLFGVMQNTRSETWNAPQSLEQISIENAMTKTCSQLGRQIADVPQTTSVLARHVGSLKGPFATVESWTDGYVTVIPTARNTLVQFEANTPQKAPFSLVSFTGYVQC